MSAVFDIQLYYKKFIPFSTISNLVIKEGASYTIDSLEIIDNWRYENQKMLEYDEITNLQHFIDAGKIVIIEGRLEKRHNFGIYYLKTVNDIYSLNLWISTKNIPMLDKDIVDGENSAIYDTLTKDIIQTIEKSYLVLCALGAETVINDDDLGKNIFSASRNVSEWIVTDEKEVSLLDEFTKFLYNDFLVCRKTSIPVLLSK